MSTIDTSARSSSTASVCRTRWRWMGRVRPHGSKPLLVTVAPWMLSAAGCIKPTLGFVQCVEGSNQVSRCCVGRPVDSNTEQNGVAVLDLN